MPGGCNGARCVVSLREYFTFTGCTAARPVEYRAPLRCLGMHSMLVRHRVCMVQSCHHLRGEWGAPTSSLSSSHLPCRRPRFPLPQSSCIHTSSVPAWPRHHSTLREVEMFGIEIWCRSLVCVSPIAIVSAPTPTPPPFSLQPHLSTYAPHTITDYQIWPCACSFSCADPAKMKWAVTSLCDMYRTHHRTVWRGRVERLRGRAEVLDTH